MPQGITPLGVFRQDLELWLRSDRLIALSGSDVLTWGDLSWKNHNFTAPLGNRPTYNLTDANWGGRPSLHFNSTPLWLDSDDAASVWKFLHDGTGGGFLAVYRYDNASTGAVLDTALDSAGIGARLLTPRTGNQDLIIANGGTAIVADATPVTSININFYGYYAWEDGRPVNEWVNSTQVGEGTGSTAGVPSAANPSATLRVGARINASQGLRGELLEVMAYSVYPTDQQFLYLKAYLYTRYGLI